MADSSAPSAETTHSPTSETSFMDGTFVASTQQGNPDLELRPSPSYHERYALGDSLNETSIDPAGSMLVSFSKSTGPCGRPDKTDE